MKVVSVVNVSLLGFISASIVDYFFGNLGVSAFGVTVLMFWCLWPRQSDTPASIPADKPESINE